MPSHTLEETIARIDAMLAEPDRTFDPRFPRESTFNATVREGQFEQVSAPGVRPIELRYRLT